MLAMIFDGIGGKLYITVHYCHGSEQCYRFDNVLEPILLHIREAEELSKFSLLPLQCSEIS